MSCLRFLIEVFEYNMALRNIYVKLKYYFPKLIQAKTIFDLLASQSDMNCRIKKASKI